VRVLLGLVIALSVLTLLYTRTVGAAENAGNPVGGQLAWVVLETFLVLRVWRGGQIAWGVLVALLLVGVATPVFLLPADAVGYLGPIVAATGLQCLVLLSPAVREHVRAPRNAS
jgi:hypothetical protein